MMGILVAVGALIKWNACVLRFAIRAIHVALGTQHLSVGSS